MIKLYADGSCDPNPGVGGWGFAAYWNGMTVTKFGGEPHATNNQMEITAVAAGLEAVRALGAPTGTVVHVYSDSQYVIKGARDWIYGWKLGGWLTKDKKPVQNKDLWMRLDRAKLGLDLTWHWVKGHNGDLGNEKAHKLAEAGRLIAKKNMKEPSDED